MSPRDAGPASARARVKSALSPLRRLGRARGTTVLIYHRVGGGSGNELDLPAASFEQQLDVLAGHDVVSLDDALDALDRGSHRPRVVLTFDDGFADVHRHAWPLLAARGVPFTIYLATAYMDAPMRWEGATARGEAGRGLAWDQIRELHASGLCTVGNHTHTHVPPEQLDDAELDRCTETLRERLGVVPRHFAYPWGIPAPAMMPALRRRFRSAVTGTVGRNTPATDRMLLRRVPVRASDPIDFFAAKLTGSLVPERSYSALVATAKRFGASA